MPLNAIHPGAEPDGHIPGSGGPALRPDRAEGDLVSRQILKCDFLLKFYVGELDEIT